MTLRAISSSTVYCSLRTVTFNPPLETLRSGLSNTFTTYFMAVVDVLWALGHELCFSSKNRDINTVQLMEVTPALLTPPAAAQTPARSLKQGLLGD